MRLAWVLVLGGLAGCSAIFGLSSAPNVDRDGDGIVDSLDNCVDGYNPDQSNFDGDLEGDVCDECAEGGVDDIDADGVPDGCDGCVGNGIDVDGDGIHDNCDVCIGEQATGEDVDGDGVDDGCDPCLLGPPHDEDADGLADACDNCPGVPNPLQVDNGETPVDGVGNACDTDTGPTAQRFDPFAAPDPSWYLQGTGWAFVPDAVLVETKTSSYLMAGSGVGRFMVATVVRMPVDENLSASQVEVFVATEQTQPAAVRVSCVLSSTRQLTLSSASPLPIAADTLVFASNEPVLLTLVANTKTNSITCTARVGVRMAQVTGGGIGLVDTWLAGLGAHGIRARFESFTVTTPR